MEARPRRAGALPLEPAPSPRGPPCAGRRLRDWPQSVSLSADSVGVDHNPTSVEACRRRGLQAVTVEGLESASVDRFDGLLAAHLLEHLEPGTAADVLRPYLRYLEPGARIVLICPQQRGFRTDDTHTVFFDDERLAAVLRALGASVDAQRSFPFPRPVGRVFTYNEFVTVGRWDGP